MQVGLKALPLNLHLQLRGFLHLGDMSVSFRFVHMLRTITGAGGNVKHDSGAFLF
jgi:hypothetical protein